MAFDAVIGLGGNCEVAHHLRRHSGLDEAHVFDWWIAPFAGTVALLESNFGRLFVAENMAVLGDGLAVACLETGIIHHHDFPRDEQARVIADAVAGRLPDLRDKFQALIARLDAACAPGRRVLFLRSWREVLHAPADYPQWAPDGAPPYDFARLVQALETRYPGLDFEVLFVNYGSQACPHPRARFANIRDMGDIVDWTGSARGWDEMLGRVVPAG